MDCSLDWTEWPSQDNSYHHHYKLSQHELAQGTEIAHMANAILNAEMMFMDDPSELAEEKKTMKLYLGTGE